MADSQIGPRHQNQFCHASEAALHISSITFHPLTFVPFRGYCLLSLRAYSRSHFERVPQEAGSTLSAAFNVSIRSVIAPDCR